jgi:hypothetical protein
MDYHHKECSPGDYYTEHEWAVPGFRPSRGTENLGLQGKAEKAGLAAVAERKPGQRLDQRVPGQVGTDLHRAGRDGPGVPERPVSGLGLVGADAGVPEDVTAGARQAMLPRTPRGNLGRPNGRPLAAVYLLR